VIERRTDRHQATAYTAQSALALGRVVAFEFEYFVGITGTTYRHPRQTIRKPLSTYITECTYMPSDSFRVM